MANRVVTFSTSKPRICGHDIRWKDGKLTFRVKCDRFHETFTLGMHGNFNVENALAAITAAYVYKIPVEYMKKGLAEVQVSGRMEEYVSGDGKVRAVVDYAHNRLSFERLFDSIYLQNIGLADCVRVWMPWRKSSHNRRRDLGLIAGLFSQKVYLTADSQRGKVEKFPAKSGIMWKWWAVPASALKTVDRPSAGQWKNAGKRPWCWFLEKEMKEDRNMEPWCMSILQMPGWCARHCSKEKTGLTCDPAVPPK